MTELRVLLCDDDPDLLEIMLRRLDRMGIKPDRAVDGAQAQALIHENKYDLIVTDIYMPEATGLELLQIAKEKDPHTQVVVVTASATLDNAIDALNRGAHSYLTKPFDHLSVFDNTVSRALEFRQLVLANARMAQAQKRRGDMLEEEVTARVRQLRLRQQSLIDLLNCLPDGILVVEEGGKVVMTSPKAEAWLARDRRSEDQPVQQFLSQVHSEWADEATHVKLEDQELKLLSVEYPHPDGNKRKAVLLRMVEDDQIDQGALVSGAVDEIKQGLAWLYAQGLGQTVNDALKQVARQLNMLERMVGSTSGGGGGGRELTPANLPEYLQYEPTLDPSTGELVDQRTNNGRPDPTDELEPARAEPDAHPEEAKPYAELLADLPEEAPEPAMEADPEGPTLIDTAEDYAQDYEADAGEAGVDEPAVDLEARLGASAGHTPDAPTLVSPAQDPTPAVETTVPPAESAQAVEAEVESDGPPPREPKPEGSGTAALKEPLWRRLAKRKAEVPPPPSEAASAPAEVPTEDLQSEGDIDSVAALTEVSPDEATLIGSAVSDGADPELALPPGVSEGEAELNDQLGPEDGRQWPPELPSRDPEFTEELDTTG